MKIHVVNFSGRDGALFTISDVVFSRAVSSARYDAHLLPHAAFIVDVSPPGQVVTAPAPPHELFSPTDPSV